MTISATLATAPLMALAFDAVSIASLPANLLALPAVAPVMWLGMLAALVGQLPGLPVEPLDLARRRCSPPTSPRSHTGSAHRPGRGRASRCPSAAGVLAAYAALGLALWVCSPGRGGAGACGGRRAPQPVALAACLGALALALAGLRSSV